MEKLETLIVPESLGTWLDNKQKFIGEDKFMLILIQEFHDYIRLESNHLAIGGFIKENTKELIEVVIGNRDYEVLSPLYLALIKGHEVVRNGSKYWNYDSLSQSSVFPSDLNSQDARYITKLSKSRWSRLGIDESNAEFVKVKEQ